MLRLTLFTLAIFVAGCTSPDSSDSPSPSIAGIWKLDSWRTLEDSGVWTEEFGSDPKGYFVYSENGFLSIHLMHESGAAVQNCKPEDFAGEAPENTFLVNPSCYVGYFGKYRLESDTTVVHLPEGGTILSYIETDQPRAYRLKGDSLWIEWSPETERLLLRME